MKKLLIKISLMIILSLPFSFLHAQEELVIKNSSILDLKTEHHRFYGDFIFITIQDKPGQFYKLTIQSRSNESDFMQYKKTQENIIIHLNEDVVISYGKIIHGVYKENMITENDSFFVIIFICFFFGLPLLLLPLLFNLKLSKE